MTENQLTMILKGLKLLWQNTDNKSFKKDIEDVCKKITMFLNKIERISNDRKGNDRDKPYGKNRKVSRIHGMGNKRSNDSNK